MMETIMITNITFNFDDMPDEEEKTVILDFLEQAATDIDLEKIK